MGAGHRGGGGGHHAAGRVRRDRSGRELLHDKRFTPLAYVIGGGLFGFGMVLAGGCGSKALVRAGAGSLKGLVVVCVLGLVAYISLRGVLAVVRVRAIESVGFDLATTRTCRRC